MGSDIIFTLAAGVTLKLMLKANACVSTYLRLNLFVLIFSTIRVNQYKMMCDEDWVIDVY